MDRRCGQPGDVALMLVKYCQNEGCARSDTSRARSPIWRDSHHAIQPALDTRAGPIHKGLRRRTLLSEIEITSSGIGFQGGISVKFSENRSVFVQASVLGAATTAKTSVPA